MSIGYANDLTVVAVSQVGAVGVDAERCFAAAFEGFDGVVGHEGEISHGDRARTVTWTRKESLLKATGHGLTVDPRQIRVTEPHEPPELVEWSGVERPDTPVWMLDLEITSKHVATLTVLSTSLPVLQISKWQNG